MTGKEKALFRIRIWKHGYRKAMSEKDYTAAHEYSARIYAAVEVLVDTEVLSKEESYAILDELTGIRKKKEESN